MVLQVVGSRPSHFGEPFSEIDPHPSSWLVKGVLPARGVAFLVGATKAGKSFFALDSALRIAGGNKMLGRKTKQTGVVYVGAEDPDGCRARVAAWRQAYRRENAELPFEFYGGGMDLLASDEVDDFVAALDVSQDNFKAQGHPLGLIVVDTMSRCLPGVNENESQGMSSAFRALDRIGRQMDCLVLVLAHFGKAGEERGIRGWSGMDCNSDATLTLERNAEDPELRTVTLAKVKNGRDGDQVNFRLEEVVLPISDEDGDPVTSCICVYEKTLPSTTTRKRKAMNPTELIVLRAIEKVQAAKPQPFPSSIEGIRPYMKACR